MISGIGGKRGWFYMNWAWEIRGFVDKITGGVGLRRGRRDPDDLRVGDALDFWRVEEVEPRQVNQAASVNESTWRSLAAVSG